MCLLSATLTSYFVFLFVCLTPLFFSALSSMPSIIMLTNDLFGLTLLLSLVLFRVLGLWAQILMLFLVLLNILALSLFFFLVMNLVNDIQLRPLWLFLLGVCLFGAGPL